MNDDQVVKRCQQTFAALIQAQYEWNHHQQICGQVVGCRECAKTHEAWKKQKEVYLLAIRDLIG